MSSSRHHGRRRKPPDRVTFLLDKFSAQDIDRWNRFRDEILRFHWDYYNSLAYQRSQISEDLAKALLEAAEGPFQFSKWQRIVTYRHADEPLSLLGSLVDPGGRFNIGDINPVQFPPFPALYAAVDKPTALQEVLCQDVAGGKEARALDSALIRPDSIAVVSVSGQLESVINLRHPARLEAFVDLIKGFSIPSHLIQKAKTLGIAPPDLVRDRVKLLEILSDPYWRGWPMQHDVPAPCQLFGQLVAKAGIEGIVYPSKFGSKDCLAIFPQNFEGADVFVQLDDPSPPGVQVRRLDATTWRRATQPSQSHESLLMRLMRFIQGSTP
jgi:hypothetical protein